MKKHFAIVLIVLLQLINVQECEGQKAATANPIYNQLGEAFRTPDFSMMEQPKRWDSWNDLLSILKMVNRLISFLPRWMAQVVLNTAPIPGIW